MPTTCVGDYFRYCLKTLTTADLVFSFRDCRLLCYAADFLAICDCGCAAANDEVAVASIVAPAVIFVSVAVAACVVSFPLSPR